MFGGPIPWVKSGELAAGVVLETEERLTEEGLASCSARLIRAGASLVAMYGATAGATSRLCIPAATNQAVAAVEPLSEQEDEYVFALVEAATPQLIRRAQGSGQPNLNKTMIERLQCFWPDEAVRLLIGKLNQQFAETIRQYACLVAAKRRLKRALMQRLLGARSADGRDCEVVRAGDAFTERDERGVGHLPLLSVTGERGVVNRDELDRRDTSSVDKSAYKRVVPDDIAYNTMRMWQGVSGLVSQEGIVSPAYTVLTPVEGVSARYCSQLFKHPRVVSLFHRHSQGLVEDTLNLKYAQFSRILLELPSPPEQERIAHLLDQVDGDITATEALAAALRLQKRGVMQKLLSGELQ